MKTYFHVDKKGESYRIGIGLGKTFKANSLNEIGYALQHYFKEDMFENKFEYNKHIEHQKDCPCCPLCRDERV